MQPPQLIIGDLVLPVPIIQGGMGVGVSKASLASAVSLEGGLGVIASVGLGEEEAKSKPYEERSCDALRSEIRKVKQKNLPVGVNVMVALSNYRDLIAVCAQEDVDAIISGAGLPMRLPEYTGDARTKLIPIVSSAKAARIICKTWQNRYDRFPDAIVVEGPLAGGHLGFKFEDLAEGTASPLETLVVEVITTVKEFSERAGRPIPVIAAGGIYAGRDIARFLDLGAAGVQMGTRFVATWECDASREYKQAFVDSAEEDVIIIRSPVGMPARVLRNTFVQRSQDGQRTPIRCPYKCLLSCDAQTANYCIAKVLLNASHGHFEDGFAMCGHNVYRVDKIVSVKELIDELLAGYSDARAAAPVQTAEGGSSDAA